MILIISVYSKTYLKKSIVLPVEIIVDSSFFKLSFKKEEPCLTIDSYSAEDIILFIGNLSSWGVLAKN